MNSSSIIMHLWTYARVELSNSALLKAYPGLGQIKIEHSRLILKQENNKKKLLCKTALAMEKGIHRA